MADSPKDRSTDSINVWVDKKLDKKHEFLEKKHECEQRIENTKSRNGSQNEIFKLRKNIVYLNKKIDEIETTIQNVLVDVYSDIF